MQTPRKTIRVRIDCDGAHGDFSLRQGVLWVRLEGRIDRPCLQKLTGILEEMLTGYMVNGLIGLYQGVQWDLTSADVVDIVSGRLRMPTAKLPAVLVMHARYLPLARRYVQASLKAGVPRAVLENGLFVRRKAVELLLQLCSKPVLLHRQGEDVGRESDQPASIHGP